MDTNRFARVDASAGSRLGDSAVCDNRLDRLTGRLAAPLCHVTSQHELLGRGTLLHRNIGNAGYCLEYGQMLKKWAGYFATFDMKSTLTHF
ncbi:MAG: hypothetical protein V2J51_06490 [Erythrobacter sp.]|jgi:hypothetical protein|nr:hypothetical protein [Erythrobacter sp.]